MLLMILNNLVISVLRSDQWTGQGRENLLFFLAVQVDEKQHGGEHNQPVGFGKTHGDDLMNSHDQEGGCQGK